jgi:hypothetical protein
MTHEECQDRLLEFAYGELGRRGTKEVEAHLAACPACAGVYRRIAGVREVMGLLEPEPPPGGGDRVVLAAAREAAGRRREERPALGLPLWAWKASVATVLVAAVAGVSVKIVSMREQTGVGPVASAPAGKDVFAERKLEGAPPADAESVAAPAEVPAARSAPAKRAPAAPPASRPAPSAAAPAPSAIGFAERRAAAEPSPEAADERAANRGRSAELEVASRAAVRQEAAAPEEAPAAAGALADAEAKAAAAPPAAGAGAPIPLSQAEPAASVPPPAAVGAPRPVAAATGRKGDPGVKAARAVVQDAEARLRQGKLSESARPFQACGPGEDAERRLYAGPDGRVVKYVRQTGSAEAALTTEQYYDGQGRLRHVYVHGGAVNGAVVEHRIWLDEEGRRLLEEQRFRRGRYPFPETWPESELEPEAPDASALRCGAQ